MFVCLLYQIVDFQFFFTASLFYPGCGDTRHALAALRPLPTSNLHLSDDDLAAPDESENEESERDWHDEAELVEAAPHQQSRCSEALAIEVRLYIFLEFPNLQLPL